MSYYPECEKLKDLAPKRDTILEFLEWLGENDMEIRSTLSFPDDEWEKQPCRLTPEQLSHLFLGIDDKKLEQERQAMLDSMRAG